MAGIILLFSATDDIFSSLFCQYFFLIFKKSQEVSFHYVHPFKITCKESTSCQTDQTPDVPFFNFGTTAPNHNYVK